MLAIGVLCATAGEWALEGRLGAAVLPSPSQRAASTYTVATVGVPLR